MAYEPIPLTARFDSPAGALMPEGQLDRWTLCAPGGHAVELGLPAYSRFLNHLSIEDGIADHFVSSFGNYGLPWLGKSKPGWDSLPMRVATVGVGVPIDVVELMNACTVQFQFFGQPHTNHPPSAYSFWKANSHPEISNPEQMAKKVKAIREMVNEGTPVGAAVIGLNRTVYDDVRFLIDSGFDYIELVTGGVTQLKPGAWLELEADLVACVNAALRARKDSRATTKLWLTAPTVDARDWIRWLGAGIDACCIDAYLTSRRPAEAAAPSSFAGIKVSIQSRFEWIASALQEFQNSFLDLNYFYSK
jgi:hypothetical protein